MSPTKVERNTEWYVMSVGNKTPEPSKIIIGRANAIFQFSHKFNLTRKERHSLDMAWEAGLKIGESILLVGYGTIPDRKLTRVPGPLIGE